MTSKLVAPSTREETWWPDWVAAAACRSSDPAAFFREGAAAEAALEVCGRCDVTAECLQYALDLGAEGIWGGTTEAARRQLKIRTGHASMPTHCSQGHAMTEDNVKWRRSQPVCRKCDRAYQRSYAAKQRAETA